MNLKNSIKLRKIREEDLSIIRDWRNAKGTREYNTQFVLLNLVNQKQWFNHIKNSLHQKMFIITKNHIPIGVCGLIKIDYKKRNADVAIIIGNEQIRNKGIGTKSLKLLLEYGFKKLKLNKIGAEIFDFNTNSKKLFENLNFKHEVKFRENLWRDGQWWDTHFYSILINEYNKNN
jgi:RimJ/RimL family protein N-acetyltransferase